MSTPVRRPVCPPPMKPDVPLYLLQPLTPALRRRFLARSPENEGLALAA